MSEQHTELSLANTPDTEEQNSTRTEPAVEGLPAHTARYDDGFRAGTHYTEVTVKKAGTVVRRFTDLGRKTFALNLEHQGPLKGWSEQIRDFVVAHDIPLAALPGLGSWQQLMPNLLNNHAEYVFHHEDLESAHSALGRWFMAHPDHKPRPTIKTLTSKGDPIDPRKGTVVFRRQVGEEHPTR